MLHIYIQYWIRDFKCSPWTGVLKFDRIKLKYFDAIRIFWQCHFCSTDKCSNFKGILRQILMSLIWGSFERFIIGILDKVSWTGSITTNKMSKFAWSRWEKITIGTVGGDDDYVDSFSSKWCWCRWQICIGINITSFRHRKEKKIPTRIMNERNATIFSLAFFFYRYWNNQQDKQTVPLALR